MTTWECIWRVAACGAFGGLVACIHREVVLLPQFDKVSKAWIPGALGTIAVGAFAACLILCLYSPSASVDLGAMPVPAISLTIRDLGSSGLVGFSGGKVLTLMAQQNAAKITKSDLTKTIKTILESQGK
jgi:hypothetical protein